MRPFNETPPVNPGIVKPDNILDSASSYKQ